MRVRVQAGCPDRNEAGDRTLADRFGAPPVAQALLYKVIG